MAQSLVAPELETLAQDLSESSVVEVYHLDDHGDPHKVCAQPGWCSEDDVRIELRPHLVVTRPVQDPDSEDGYRLETTEIPLGRVLIAKVLEDDAYGQPYDTVQRALWVNGPHGQLLRLVP